MSQTAERPWGRPASSNPEPQGGAAFAASREAYHGRGRRASAELVRVDTPQGSRVVGAFVRRDGEEVFEKLADARSHLLLWPCEGWAVAVEALHMALARGVRRVIVRDRRRGIWWAQVSDFERHGVPIDRRWGPQVALGLNWFSFVPANSRTAKQLGLFGEAGR